MQDHSNRILSFISIKLLRNCGQYLNICDLTTLTHVYIYIYKYIYLLIKVNRLLSVKITPNDNKAKAHYLYFFSIKIKDANLVYFHDDVIRT